MGFSYFSLLNVIGPKKITAATARGLGIAHVLSSIDI